MRGMQLQAYAEGGIQGEGIDETDRGREGEVMVEYMRTRAHMRPSRRLDRRSVSQSVSPQVHLHMQTIKTK